MNRWNLYQNFTELEAGLPSLLLGQYRFEIIGSYPCYTFALSPRVGEILKATPKMQSVKICVVLSSLVARETYIGNT